MINFIHIKAKKKNKNLCRTKILLENIFGIIYDSISNKKVKIIIEIKPVTRCWEEKYDRIHVIEVKWMFINLIFKS